MLPLFKFDDKKVKKTIKDAVGAKEGDFNGQNMMCGTTVNPVVVINNYPKMVNDATFSVTAVQNTWYTVLDVQRPVVVYNASFTMATADEDIEFRITVDDIVVSGSQAGATFGVLYSVYRAFWGESLVAMSSAVDYRMFMQYSELKCSGFKYEIRKTSANGANTLSGRVVYGEI